MKTLFKASLIVSLFILSACGEKEPEAPPHIGSLENIVIDGEQYTIQSYWDTFCKEKFELHETCEKVDDEIRRQRKMKAMRESFKQMGYDVGGEEE